MILWGKNAKDLVDRVTALEASKGESGDRLDAIEREMVRQMTAEKQQEVEQQAIISAPDEEGEVWPKRNPTR